MGSWLGGRTSAVTARTGAVPEAALYSPFFYIGVAMWFFGFLGNLVSDEVLYDLRRPTEDGKKAPRYSIPYGFLYTKPLGGISFPAYFCEWIEWLGFAIAACSHSSAPAFPALGGHNSEASLAEAGRILAQSGGLPYTRNKLLDLGTYATPPFMFLFAEVASECFHTS